MRNRTHLPTKLGGALLPSVLALAAAAQQPPPSPALPPSEELKASVAPFDAARAQPDDLTDADQLALGVGMARAARACLALQPSLPSLSKQPDETLALARLCLFGQQWEAARVSAVDYLELPVTPERETGLVLLMEAFLGLKNPVNAAEQVFSLERDYPYGAQIYLSADQVIAAGALGSDQMNSMALLLCADQIKAALPLLEKGQGVTGKDASASPSTLVADAVRCVDIARALHDASAGPTLSELQKILALPVWQGRAELAPSEAAVARTSMVNGRAPFAVLTGQLVRANGPLFSRALPLAVGTVLLVPFTLWAPSTLSAIRDVPATAPGQAIYLVTSWSANTGGADVETPALLASLRAFAQSLPLHVSILVVPQAFLDQFHADTFPPAIVIRGGVVEANLPLLGDAAKRLTVLALGLLAPPLQRHR